MKTKVKQHFIAIESKRTISRTYGGSNYTLQIYENKGPGELVHLGEVSACTRGHKGEASEAWGKIVDLKAVKPSIMKKIKIAAKDPENKNYSFFSYWSWKMADLFGVVLEIK